MEPADFRNRRFDGAGVTLAATVSGDPGSPTVLFMHGGGQTRHSWGNAVAAAAAQGYYAVSIDLRGHGESDWSPDGNYAFDVFAEDARAVIAQLGPHVVIVGASLGGVAGLMVSGERPPPPIAALVLVDVAPTLEVEGIAEISRFMRAAPTGFASLDEAMAAVAAYQPHRKRPNSSEGLLRNLRLKPDGRYHWHWDPAFIAPGSSPDPERYRQRLERAARALSIPTLLVRGALSRVVSREGAAALLAMTSAAEYIDVAGADHMVAGDQNDAFNAAVLAFVAKRVFQ